MYKSAEYNAKFSVTDATAVRSSGWKNFLSAAASLASQYNVLWSAEPQAFCIRAAHLKRHLAELLVLDLFKNLEYFISQTDARIEIADNSALLEDLLNQMRNKMRKDIMINDWYIYYVSPKTADALRCGNITSYLDVMEHKKHYGTTHYGEEMRMHNAVPEIRSAIEKLESKGRMGLVMSIEMLYDAQRVAYFGPFLNLTGNYRTRLSVRQQKPAPICRLVTVTREHTKPNMPLAKIIA